ncbi:MAG TPA: lysylphosphatidylglycerol synthase domain-containing protein, partial [Nakamurella sp.]
VTHVALTLLVLLALPGPAVSWLLGPLVVVLAVVVVLLAVAAGSALLPRRGTGSTRLSRLAGMVVADLRTGVLARSAWPQIVVASVVVALGHAVTFVIAARLVGVAASPPELVPVAMVVLAAMLVPVNVGGWGPRESVAAAVFGAAGWGSAAGVAAATAFGVLTLIATLPGLVVLLTRPSVDGRVDADG